MARKNQSHYPIVRRGKVGRETPITDPAIEISLNAFLSKTNRRLYRQARCYTAKIDLDVNADQSLDVFVLNDSWMTHKSLQMAYAMYLKNSEDERSRLNSDVIARWEDFRVLSGLNFQFADPIQYSNLLGATRLVEGEFPNTRVVDDLGVQKSFSWGSPTASRYSIIEEYDKAGNAQAAPSSATNDVPYNDLMADDSAAMATDLQNLGNLPPYSQNGVNGDRQWVKVGTLGTGATQKLSTGYFVAPCGIVLIRNAFPGSPTEPVNAERLTWEVKAGDYKGVHAPSMLE